MVAGCPDPVGVVLDLDDTLILERDYVRSGFAAVGRALGVDHKEADLVESFLWSGFLSGRRGGAFDALFERFPHLRDRATVADCVRAYREHEPELSFIPGVAELLTGLRIRGWPVAVISDGALAGQEAKVRSLGLGRWAEPVILTDRWGRDYWKPHPRAFREVQTSLGLPPDRLVYVGDNPAKDFQAPHELGWYTVRLRRAGQLHVDLDDGLPAPALCVRSIDDLGVKLDEWAQHAARPHQT